MKDKKGVFNDYIIWIIIGLAVVVLVAIIIYFEGDFMSGFFSNMKNKLRFGF
jgi:hypothetical protein